MTMKQEMIFLCLMGLRLKTWTVFSIVGRSDKSYIFLSTDLCTFIFGGASLTWKYLVLICSLTICVFLQMKPECIRSPAAAATSPVSCDYLFSSPDSPLSSCFRVVSTTTQLTCMSTHLALCPADTPDLPEH